MRRTRLARSLGPPLGHIVILLLLVSIAAAQHCSATSLCATGCCSKDGYCGIGPSYCDASVCVSTCDYTATRQCDADNPCVEGCCSKYGSCGFGPNFCAPRQCVSTCDAKSECDPGSWGPTYAQSATCPLNVCCSKYGFCGTTTEYCGNATPFHFNTSKRSWGTTLTQLPGRQIVRRPSCPKTGGVGSIGRVVGYYEEWSRDRHCKVIYPEQIPHGVYTHLNFAFASIDPHTFEVVPITYLDPQLYPRLIDMKRVEPDLKINIVIGGWGFTEPGAPTATTFSDLVASEENQRRFFISLLSFMTTYDFDGVDIDWQYPAASGRGGRPEDVANFPKFIANLKRTLRSKGGKDELSITLPASYQYLQHYDLKALSQSVDYFNYKSYDLHGTWDKGNAWTGPLLNAHTNLTEIISGLDLLWRNHVPPDKVVLGLAFYGRGFTVPNMDCIEPGCTFLSGANAAECSRITGLMMNNEIDEIRDLQKLQPKLYRNAAVQVLTWDDQWLAYDDQETFQLKVDFAKSQCLGGVHVWAVSHDDKNGTFSKALASAIDAEYQHTKAIIAPDPPSEYAELQLEQFQIALDHLIQLSPEERRLAFLELEDY